MSMEILKHVLHTVVEFGIIILEAFGFIILAITAIRRFIGYFKKVPEVELKFTKGIALALEFLLCGEVLHTILVQEWREVIVLGAGILLHVVLSVLIHWEMKHHEEKGH